MHAFSRTPVRHVLCETGVSENWISRRGIEMDREELLQRIDTSWQDLQQVLQGIPPEWASEPGAAGDWSVKDLLGHITFWERNCATDVQRLGPEEPVEE